MSLAYDSFIFTHRSLQGRTVRLGYRLEGKHNGIDLEERLQLPFDPQFRDKDTRDIEEALMGLHLIAGISYWKTCCPLQIQIEGDKGLSRWDVSFWNEVYTQGLGEFFFRNGIDPRGRVNFPSHWSADEGSPAITEVHGPALVLVGGGKDSILTHEILQWSGRSHKLFYVGKQQHIEPLIKSLKVPRVLVMRHLDQNIFDLNAAGALNGHIPVSAYYAFAAQFVAILNGFGAVVAANERSASSVNLQAEGLEVNHQWSKGIRFETLFQEWQRRHLRCIPTYFSMLRPLSEMQIAQAFARYPAHFTHFSSCNRNFRQHGNRIADRWCGHCSKCLFVYCMLAPWLNDTELARIFTYNLLALEENLSTLAELLGVQGHKPFDCVGTPDEVAAALWMCYSQGRYRDLPLMRLFAERILPGLTDPETLVKAMLTPSDEHLIPPLWSDVLFDFLTHS